MERSKRKRSDGYNSDDSDFDDLRTKVADASAAMKAVRFAPSATGTGAQRSVKSMGARSTGSGRSARSDRSGKSSRDVKRGPTITGDRREHSTSLTICRTSSFMVTGKYSV